MRLALVLLAAAVYFGTPMITRRIAPNYNHFPRLAAALIHGRLTIPTPVDSSDHVEELIPAASGEGFYCAYPPLPAFLMTPFVLLFGQTFSSSVACRVLSVVNVLLFDACILSFWRRRGCGRPSQPRATVLHNRWLLDLFFAFGTVVWHNAHGGGDWHLAHAVTLAAGLLSLREFFGDARPGVLGCFLSLILLTRPTAALACLFLVLPIVRARSVGRWARLAAAPIAALVLLGAYNAARFDDPFDFGYSRMILGGTGKQFMETYGQFHPHFIARNFFWFFLAPPWPGVGGRPILGFDPRGMSLIAATPALVYCFVAAWRHWKDALVRDAVLSVGVCLVPLLLYFNTGYVQFGHRFSMDYLVALMPLVLLGIGRSVSMPAKVLLGLSIAIQFTGNVLQPIATLPVWLAPWGK